MGDGVRESIPRSIQFDVGGDASRPAGSEDIVGIVKRTDQAGASAYGKGPPIFGLIENNGDAPLVFEVEQSSDNGASDAWAVKTIRVNSGTSLVASVTVPGRGKASFSIETTTEEYLRFNATPTTSAKGRLTLAYWFGELQSRLTVGTP